MTEIGAIEKLYPNSTNIQSANPIAFTLNCKLNCIHIYIYIYICYHLYFFMEVPLNLDTKMKIVLLGAVFLLVSVIFLNSFIFI